MNEQGIDESIKTFEKQWKSIKLYIKPWTDLPFAPLRPLVSVSCGSSTLSKSSGGAALAPLV